LYDLENGSQLNLSISEAAIQFPEKSIIPVVLFSGNFSYDLSKISGDDRPSAICRIVSDWRTNLKDYTALIEENFAANGIDVRVIGDAQGTLLNSDSLVSGDMGVSLLSESGFQKT
jgi:hypothetical protein